MLNPKNRNPTFCLLFVLFTFLICFRSSAQLPELSPADRDNLKSQSIALVKEFEQLLNVLAHKGTSPADASDIVILATTDNQTRIFSDPKVVLEDDIYSLNADSVLPKDVSVQKYLIDWDLFYTKGFEKTVNFSDLRLSNFAFRGYLFLKVYYESQFKNKHKYFDRNYVSKRRVATIRFDLQDGKYIGHIIGISFFRPKGNVPVTNIEAVIDEEFKPFVKEHRVFLDRFKDSTASESQPANQRKNDSLYVEAVKFQMQKSKEQMQKDLIYTKSIAKGDSLLALKDFGAAIDAYVEARAQKPLETYPRAKIKQIAKLLSSGTTDPNQMLGKQIEEGDMLFKNRDYEGARQAYQSAYMLSPTNSLVMDKFYQTDKIIKTKSDIRNKYLEGNFKQALKEYAAIIQEGKLSTDFHLERAKCYQAMGDNKKALADLSVAIGSDPKFVEALKWRASVYLKMEDFVNALKDYSTLISIDPKNAELHQRRGLILVNSGQPDAALDEFNLALSIDQKDVQSATAKAEILRKKGKLDDAVKAADLALATNPNYSSALFQKGLILLEKGNEAAAAKEIFKATFLGLTIEEEKELTKQHDALMEKSKAFASANKWEEAIIFADKAFTLKPKSVETAYFIATQKLAMGKPKDAIAKLEQCITIKENYIPAYNLMGQIHFTQKEYGKAKFDFKNALYFDKANNEASQGLGDLFIETGQADSALIWLNHAFSLKSANAHTLLNRSKCHYIMENYHKALLDIENAIREDYKLAEAYFYKGLIQRNMRLPYEAIDNLNQAQKLGFNKYKCNLEIGQTYIKMGSLKQALKAYSDAINLMPELPDAYAKRGLTYFEMDDFANAKADLETAFLKDSSFNHTESRMQLGVIYLKSKEFARSQETFEKILQLDANQPQANYFQAICFFNQGKSEAAMASFEKAFESGSYEWKTIKKDPLMTNILEDKAFSKIKGEYFK